MLAGRSRLGAIVSHEENRHATAGCLLSVLLLLPYLACLCNPFVVFVFGFLYAVFIVPLLLSYITISACFRHFCTIINIIGRLSKHCAALTYSSVTVITKYVLRLHGYFTHVETVHTMSNQVVFFMLVEKVVCPKQHFQSLYSLLLFNIVAYIRKSLQDRHWSQPLPTMYIGDVLHTTARFLTLKLAKAVVLTMVLMMLTVQLKHYEPNLKYLLLTGIYFINTTEDFEGRFIMLLKKLELEILEGLEEFWTPIALKVLVCVYATTVMVLIFPRHIFLSLVACYTNLYLGYWHLMSRAIPRLHEEMELLEKYPFLKKWQLECQNIDCTCAVCLDSMTYSRLTPCRHAFHGKCLRRWLKENNVCPLCKQTI